MRAIRLVGFLAVAFPALASCNRPYYQWSSDQGRQCFYECQRGRYLCRASCYNDLTCLFRCNGDEEGCMNTCPDLALVKK